MCVGFIMCGFCNVCVCVCVCVGFVICRCLGNVSLYLLCFVLCLCIVSFMYINS